MYRVFVQFFSGYMVVVLGKSMIYKNLFLIFDVYIFNMDLFKFSILYVKLNGG